LFRAGLILSILSLASTAAAQTPPVIVYPAGQYLVTTPAATTITWTGTSVTLSWAVATPTPKPPTPPTPTPNPPAPPAPTPHIPQIVGTLYVIQLVDGAPTPAQAALASSATIQQALTKLNAHWYSWTTKSAEAACWLDDHDVKATGYPALLLVTANGAGNAVLSYIAKLPDTEADVLAIVQATRTKERN
jgi:hypothetical protein